MQAVLLERAAASLRQMWFNPNCRALSSVRSQFRASLVEITERYEEGEPHDGSPAKERSAYVFVLDGNASSEDWRSVKQSLQLFFETVSGYDADIGLVVFDEFVRVYDLSGDGFLVADVFPGSRSADDGALGRLEERRGHTWRLFTPAEIAFWRPARRGLKSLKCLQEHLGMLRWGLQSSTRCSPW